MKKKIVIFVLLCIISIMSILLIAYRGYGREQAIKYTTHFVEVTHRPIYIREPIITEDVQVEKILRQTPFELIFLIKWGDDEKAYASIKNWMTKAHDTIEVQVIDKSKLLVIYE
jgi:4-hydroxy-3-methylbut-2-enyl diphosphate reductase IspH